MGEKIRLGDFGRFVFNFCREITMKVNGKKKRIAFNDPRDMEGMEVTEVDGKTILLKGLEGEKQLVNRRDIKVFEPDIKPNFHIRK